MPSRRVPSPQRLAAGGLRGDVLAGLTVWAVLVPEALAYATIAGVPPVVGLYAAVPALLLYAALGSSRLLIVGPMSATAALSAATVADVATGGREVFVSLTVALAIATGLAALLAGALRLGFLASFISEPVMKGFIVGLAITILVGQLPTLVGVEPEGDDAVAQLAHLVGALGAVHATTLAVGAASLVLLLVLRRRWPAAPAALLTVAFGVAAVRALGLAADGVAVVGPISGGLPSFGLPDASLADYRSLVPGALGIMLVAFAESFAAARAWARRGDPEIEPDRELVALGAANLGSGLAGGFVVSGSLSKTAVNVGAGARTKLSGLIVAGLTIVTLLALTDLFEDLPEATLAAVVIGAVVDLIDLPSLARFYRTFAGRSAAPFSLAVRPDFVAAVAALVGVLILGVLPGLFVGVGVSLLLLIYRASRPHIARLGRAPGSLQYTDIRRHPENVPPDGVVVLRVESPLFFANARVVRAAIEQAAREPGVGAVVLDAETVPTIDVTAAHMLAEVVEDLERDGVHLLLARDVSGVRDVLRRAAEPAEPAPLTRVFPTVAEAVAAAHALARGHDRSAAGP